MKTRARKNRTVLFDALEGRLVMSTTSTSLMNLTPANNVPGAYGVYANIANGGSYNFNNGHQANGIQRNQIIVRDMGQFFQQYAAQVPALVNAVNTAQSTAAQLESAYSNQQNTTSTTTTTTSTTTVTQEQVSQAEQAVTTAYDTLYQTVFGLTNSLGVQLYADLGSNSAGQVRTLITGLPANYDGVSYPTSGPHSGSLLATLNSLYYSDLADLQIVANLDIAGVYALAYNNVQVFPNAPFASFYNQYTADLAQPVAAYNTAVQNGDTTGIQAAEQQIDNITRTDVYNLQTTLLTASGTKFAAQIQDVITGTPGPIAQGGTTNNGANNNGTPTTTPAPGAPAYGSLLATLNSLPYGYRNDPTLLASVVQYYASI